MVPIPSAFKILHNALNWYNLFHTRTSCQAAWEVWDFIFLTQIIIIIVISITKVKHRIQWQHIIGDLLQGSETFFSLYFYNKLYSFLHLAFFNLLEYLGYYSISTHNGLLHSFFKWLYIIMYIIYVHNSSYHFPLNRHLGKIQFFAITNNVTVNGLVFI